MIQDKILLVDDREDNLMSIELTLEPDGYQCVKARSGREALKILLNQFDFALILMDVNMPNLNGFDTATLIYERERLRHIPIIFITANNYGDENMFKGYRSGAVDYIYKPVNPALLRTKVGVFVDLYRKNRQLREQERRMSIINKNLEEEISERKASEEKVNELNHQLLEYIGRLEAANTELDRFAFMASHDLQEPLRKIRMFCDRLSIKYRDRLDEEGQMFINRIQNSGARMQALIEDILTFSKISFDNNPLEETDVNSVIKEILSELDDQIVEKKAVITVGEIPKLNLIQGLMYPLFQNLLSNALKYSRKDVRPEISISSEMLELNENGDENQIGKYCRIYIRDNGLGFEQQYAEKIFAMFSRLHQGPEYQGTGIGLALCKKILEQHKGFISARSAVNKGATFILSFPVYNSVAAEVPTRARVED
ncbi:response regulator [Pollutibacter soli]|uniref:response regulator n=1 Tax=Pollutibacter soli TaxID=3034157 RepID=UPI0030136ED9